MLPSVNTPDAMLPHQQHLSASPGPALSPHRYRPGRSPSLAERALSIASSQLVASPASSDALFQPADFRPVRPFASSIQSSTGFARHRAALHSHRDSLTLSLTPRFNTPVSLAPALVAAPSGGSHEIVPRSPPILPCTSPVHPRRPRSRPILRPSLDHSAEALVLPQLKPPQQPPGRPVSLPPSLDATGRASHVEYFSRKGDSLDSVRPDCSPSFTYPKLPRSFSFSPGTVTGRPSLTGSPDPARPTALHPPWNSASPLLAWSPAMSMTSTAITDCSSPLRTSDLVFDGHDLPVQTRRKGSSACKASPMSVSARKRNERDLRYADLSALQQVSPKTVVTSLAHRQRNTTDLAAHGATELHSARAEETLSAVSADSHDMSSVVGNAASESVAEHGRAHDAKRGFADAHDSALPFFPISLGTSMSSPTAFSHARRMSGLQPLFLRPSPANSPKHESVGSSSSLPAMRRVRRSRPHALVLYSSTAVTPPAEHQSVETHGTGDTPAAAQVPAKVVAVLGMDSPKTGSLKLKSKPLRPKAVAVLGTDSEATPARACTPPPRTGSPFGTPFSTPRSKAKLFWSRRKSAHPAHLQGPPPTGSSVTTTGSGACQPQASVPLLSCTVCKAKAAVDTDAVENETREGNPLDPWTHFGGSTIEPSSPKPKRSHPKWNPSACFFPRMDDDDEAYLPAEHHGARSPLIRSPIIRATSNLAPSFATQKASDLVSSTTPAGTPPVSSRRRYLPIHFPSG